MLSTLMIPTGGSARIRGFDPATQPNSVRQQIGVVFQSASTDVKLTAAENLWHQGHLYGLSGARLKACIAEMLGRVGLADRANDKVETFSGGQQRRGGMGQMPMHPTKQLARLVARTPSPFGERRAAWDYFW